MKLVLKTNSLVLPSSGVKDIIEDISFQKDRDGIPFIPGKTIKGLLEEAATSLIQLLPEVENDVASVVDTLNIKTSLFGAKGAKVGGKLFIPNLYLHFRTENNKEYDYRKIIRNIKLNPKGFSNLEISDRKIRRLFSEIRNQTALDPGTEAIKTGSLRRYRLIISGQFFAAELDTAGLSGQEISFIKLSCLLVERMGVRRNRGWGNITLTLEGTSQVDPEIEIKKLNLIEPARPILQPPKLNDLIEEAKNDTEDWDTLNINIKLLAPIILSDIHKSTFNAETKDYIPGKTIRGSLANLFLQKYDLQQNPKSNDVFRGLFIDTNLIIENAYLSTNNSPQHLAPILLKTHKYSLASEEGENGKKIAYNWFLKKPDGKVKDVASSGMLTTNLEWCGTNVITESHFHHERDRIKGKNTSGAIYYYESIEEGQNFQSRIMGNKELLVFIEGKLIGESTKSRLGKSKSAQYGHVHLSSTREKLITNSDKDLTSFRSNEWAIYTHSPVVIVNNKGLPDPSIVEAQLIALLTGKGSAVEIIGRIVRYGQERMYIPMWNSYGDITPCLMPGSSFFVRFAQEITKENLEEKLKGGLGEWTHLGFGQWKVWGSDKHEVTLLEFDPPDNSIDESYTDPDFPNAIKVVADTLIHLDMDDVVAICAFRFAYKIYHNDHLKGQEISNSYSGRVIELLNGFESYDLWSQKIKEMAFKPGSFKPEEEVNCEKLDDKNLKPGANKLKDAGLLKDLCKMKIPKGALEFDVDKRLQHINEGQYGNRIAKFWILFFKALQKLNIHDR